MKQLWQISDLLPDIAPDQNREFRDLKLHAGDITPGDIFIARRGTQRHGQEFIEDAIQNGAVAIFSDAPYAQQSAVPIFIIPDLGRVLGQFAAKIYAPLPRHIMAVTGTSGKSSVVDFTRQIWESQDIPAASIGTIGVIQKDRTQPLDVTTPDVLTMHRMMRDLAHEKIDHVALEASSHGLSQGRLDGISFFAAAFTNLSQDHLDYHHDMDDYFCAKQKIFAQLPPNHYAILNRDIPQYEALEKLCQKNGQKILSYSLEDQTASLWAEFTEDQKIKIKILDKTATIPFPLYGAFQLSNALCAASFAYAGGMPAQTISAGLSKLRPVPGRMELVANLPGPNKIFVDYAHKPEALEKLLLAMRPLTKGRIVLVFGCGGDRDKTKRPIMGALAERLADIVIVTDDNPRSEDPDLIRRAILDACPKAINIGDRHKAIEKGIALLEKDDNLVIAGKGHENGQKIGNQILPFHDATVIQNILKTQS